MAEGQAYPAQLLQDNGETLSGIVGIQFTDNADQPGTGGGGGGQSGDGSPTGVVTPASIGGLYTDTTQGGLYIAVGLTDTDWIIVGGQRDQSDNDTPGFGMLPD